MSPELNFIIFPVIGAIIGAVTNQLAIKMLFRPYKPVMIGSFKLPFTPGLIPQQRAVIAKNIAQAFEQNLLSGQDLKDLITSDQIEGLLNAKVDEFFASLGPFAAMAAGFKPKILEKILEAINEIADTAMQNGGDLHVADKIEARINAMDIEVLEELVLGFSKEQFRYITIFGGILGALIGIIQATITVCLN